MASIANKPTVNLQITLSLNESEARALRALTDYGIDSFLGFFYNNLGRSCLEPHESGLRSLFYAAKTELPPVFKRIDDARELFQSGQTPAPVE